MLIIWEKINTVLIRLKFLSVIVLSGLLAVGVSACSKRQLIVPSITDDPNHQHLIGKFVWYDLFTHDLNSSSRFYEELFGWSFQETQRGEKTVRTILRNGVPIANAVQIDSQNPDINESQWLSYMSVENVDQASMRVTRQKGTIYVQPKDLPDRGRIAVAIDPQGALFAMVDSSSGDPPDASVSDLENGWMGSELWTTDLEAAIEFYRSIAGYEIQLVEVSKNVKYHLLLKNEKIRAGAVAISWNDIKPNWVPYIAVAEVVSIARKAESLGGKVLIEPDPAIREGRVAIIADPTDAVFAIQEP